MISNTHYRTRRRAVLVALVAIATAAGCHDDLTGVPAAIVSTGSAREDTIMRDDSIAAHWFRLD